MRATNVEVICAKLDEAAEDYKASREVLSQTLDVLHVRRLAVEHQLEALRSELFKDEPVPRKPTFYAEG